MTEPRKPWLNQTELQQIFSNPAVRSDGDAVAHLAGLGYEVSRRAITDARRKFGIPAPSKASLIQIDEDAATKTDYAALWSIVEDLQSEIRKSNSASRNVNVTPKAQEPIGIAFMGDLHIGDNGTDHKALRRDAELVAGTENLYCTLGGDYLNNFIKGGKKIKNHEAVPVETAWRMAEYLMGILAPSTLAIMLGNHDAWTDQMAEIDYLGELVNRLGVPYGSHGANVLINFDKVQYKIRLRHKYRFESSQNILNAVKQMYRHDGFFDIGVLHHLHQPGFEMFMQPPTGQVWAVRPGSYKVEDDYAFALGYSDSGPGQSHTFGTDNSCKYSVPVAVLRPDRREINMFATIVEGINYLEYLKYNKD